ncbi:ABC transporter ATP-binding protein [Pseudomaricurvus alcaniphilus]|uniref:oligopeptide/dipeptide ABC transporter ATP-binding protein n=1 Tax=Pseudomaricurvus alcaniphilus TaxID=1166482 RepID=UPI00140C87C4|nr:ABC transporter ATP-binding protein [Pseudomaricurvus alcaniphilus]
MSAHVEVQQLQVVAETDTGGTITIVDDVSFAIDKGQVLALIGESGSGKTTIALSLMGYARGGCRLESGSIRIGATEVMDLSREQLGQLRGRRVSYVAQSAAASFNPSRTIMDQVTEVAAIHHLMPRQQAQKKAVELFRALALPEPDSIGSRYPHQVSGGQLQRLMAAMALISDPELVIFDEPTTALDVTTQIDVLRAFKKVVQERNITAVYVSHDLAVVAQMADQVVVLNKGAIREQGATAQVLDAPRDEYTRTLMAAARQPQRHGPELDSAVPPLLEVRNLLAGYGKIDRQGQPAVPILSDINVSLQRGATLGVIGESGSGKSTLARVIAGLLGPAAGQVLFDGEVLPPTLKGRSREQFRRIQIVFQNADTALNPAHTIARILGRPLTFYHGYRGAKKQQRIAELLELVQLPANLAGRPCSELSGGQKQRINLARALAAEPDLILCDEVTSALDTVVGAAILDLLTELRSKLNLSLVFISHDISTVRSMCDEILVLYSGQKVEYGRREHFVKPPFHPYTDLLIASVPELQQGWLERVAQRPALPEIGRSVKSLELCHFLERCPVRIDGRCNRLPPPRVQMQRGNEVLCHHGEQELRELEIPPLKCVAGGAG